MTQLKLFQALLIIFLVIMLCLHLKKTGETHASSTKDIKK